MTEPEKNETPQTVTCPKCGQEVEYFTSKPRSKWVRCPKCGASLLRKEVPQEFIKVEEGEEEEEEGEEKPEGEGEGAFEIYEKPKTPSEVLREVLEEYDINPKAIDYLVRKGELRGGWHPTDLGLKLEELSKKFTGIEDERIIPDIVEDYWLKLQEEEEKARRLGMRIIYPIRRGGERRDYGYRSYGSYGYGYGYGGYERPQRYEEYGVQRYYEERPKYYEERPTYGSKERVVGFEDLERLRRDVIEAVREMIEEKKEKEKFEKLEDRVMTIEKEFTALKEKLPQLVGEAVDSLKDEIMALRTTLETPKKGEEPKVVTRDDLQALEQRLQELIEQRRLKEELEKERERAERLEKIIAELKEKVSPPPVVGSTKEDVVRDLGKELIELGREALNKAPVTRIIKVVAGKPEEAPRVEEVGEEGGVEKYVDKELVEEK